MLPVRPHASAYVRCVVVMCRECYRAWRHRHRTQPVPLLCPCCREPVYPGDVPPDALLVALTADLPVRCEACGSTVEHGALEAHRAEECSRLAMRRMIEVHRPPNTTTLTAVAAAADWWWCQATQEAWEGDDHPCCAHPAAGCQWAHVVRRLLVHPEVATDLGDHLRDVFGGFPTADALRRCAPVCDLMRSALPPDAVVDPVRLLLQGYHRGPPLSVLILVHRWLVTGGGRGIALLVEAAREHLVHTIRTDPHRAPEWMTPAAAGLLGELRGVLTELLLHDHDTTFTVTEFHVDLWLHGWKHGLLGDVPTSDADHHQQIMWARYWQAANPEQRAECVLLVMAHEGGWPPSIQGLLLGWWSAADVPVVAGEQLPPPLSWSRASALVLATHARGEASCSSWLQEFAQQPHPASANVLLYAMVCHHPHRADPVWQALVRSHLLVPLLRHLSDTATCPPISVPPVLLMPPLARGAVPQLDPAIACLRLQGEHLLLCLHRRLPQEDVPWTATWFGYFLLYLSAGGSIPALRRMRIGRSHNDTLVRSLWAVLQRPPPWWPSDTRAFLPALVAVLLPSRCPTEGWSVLRSALTGIGTDDDLTVAERRDLDPAVEALVYDTNPQLLDVGLFPTLSLLMRAGLLQGGSRTLVAVRRILLAVPVADWTADRVDRVRACGCASLTDALAYQWVGAAATDPVVCDRLLCPTEPDPDADTTATPFLVARILLHLEKGALLPVWVAAKATTSSPVDDLVACFRPEPAPPRRIHRLLQHVYGLLEDAACEAFPWWMQWHEAVVGHPKQTRASLVVHIIERLLRRFLWGGLSPTRPRPRPLPVDLEQRLLELVHQHPVHMFLLLVVGGWRAHAPLEDVCHEWWAQRPERLSQFVAAWLSDGDTPHTTLLMAFQQTAATHPLWVLRSVTLAGLVRSGKCMGCFVDAIEGLWIQYRNPAWAVADVTQLGRELLLGTVRQRWLVPWAQTDSCFATHTHTHTHATKQEADTPTRGALA